MEFDYDPQKSAANKAKHGIDFEEAALVWNDENLSIVPMRSDTEPRFAAIGMVNNTIRTVIFTPRGDTIRIISARRARAREVAHYEQG
ncbi:MAG: BrnT family toxin [Desulfovibrionaceae bacterium]|nr:BrnT family toxin [Desulfovibrionaceae bacterium]